MQNALLCSWSYIYQMKQSKELYQDCAFGIKLLELMSVLMYEDGASFNQYRQCRKCFVILRQVGYM